MNRKRFDRATVPEPFEARENGLRLIRSARTSYPPPASRVGGAAITALVSAVVIAAVFVAFVLWRSG